MADSVVDILLRARGDFSELSGEIGGLQKQFQNLVLPKGMTASFEKEFAKLTPLIKDYQKQLNKGVKTSKDVKNLNQLRTKIDDIFSNMESEINQINQKEVRLKIDTQQLTKLRKELAEAQADITKYSNNMFKTAHPQEEVRKNVKMMQAALNDSFKTGNLKFPEAAKLGNELKKAFDTKNFAGFNNKIDEIKNKILSLSEASRRDIAKSLNLSAAEKDIKTVDKAIITLLNDMALNRTSVKGFEEATSKAKVLEKTIKDIEFNSITNGTKAFEELSGSLSGIKGRFGEIGASAEDAGAGIMRMVDEVNDLKTSTQYFFSLRNMINLLKRGIDDAIQSVKELDKAMTETAVVTDFSVADMWKDLPKYTKIANDLGATTQGAYETMTLYYQQGLNQQQAFELGAETMKMARIAGLDYAETTDMMTAALRGFNMELDEVSAKRVNDVYSKLAAVTASDTEELGTAMQRTASIAHSAGMSFEGTTAFLAQAIETTREPAENIGTAMKTIVARFQEMKKNPLEITEVDGEEVSYNKVDEALQSIGVSLKDTNGQFRELDQVFLDISSRWDSLSQVQQRYIATTAAGSRQQSRFIAMMDNYDRTMQLMEAATDSAGASDEQFGKTMDSLESKLNKLHNAWQAFTMGIANNNMVKLAVDGLTGFLTLTNKIIDTLSLGSGVIKSFLSVFAAFTGLKTGGKAVNALIGGLGGLVDPQKTFKEGLKTGFFGSGRDQLQADRISNPIVKAINGLIPVIQGKVEGGVNAFSFGKNGDYGAARKKLNELLWEDKGLKNGGKYSLNNIRTILNDNQLTKEQQKAFFRSSPGLTKNIAKNLGNALEQAGAKPEVAQGLAKGFQRGEFSLDEVLLQGGLGVTADEHYNKLNATNPEEATKFRNSLIQKGIQKGLKDKDLENYIKNSVIPTEAGEEFLSQLQQMSSAEKVADGLGKAGAALTNFGSNLQMVGANLSTVNPQLGQFISGLGNMMTTAGSAVSAISNLANPIALVGVAIGAAIYMDQKRLQGIRDAADKVTESYKNIHDQTTENINNLKSYQNEFASLVEGVDRNGNNINLDTTQYDRYLEIVDEIARLNPEIVEGYNAQGHAIITNNEALDETIKKQKQLQDEATKKYLDDDSLDKLIKARDINNDYIDSLIDRKTKGQIQKTYGAVNDQTVSQFMGKQTALSPQVMAIGKQIEKSDLYKENKQAVNEILGQYDITLADLEAGQQKAVNVFKAHSADIKSQLATAAGIADVEFSDKFNTAFDQWETSLSGFNESIEGIYQNLSTSISSSGLYDEIDTKLRPAFQAGLKDIAATGDTAKQMKADAAALATEFSNLTNSSSDYAKAMEQVTDLQDQFASDLDADAYTKAINAEDGPIAVLNEQLKLLEGRTDAAAQAQREFLENEIDSITKFTESSFGNLSSALNTLQDDIAQAEGAFEAFSKSVESDYSTAVKGMQNIYDKIFEEVDINGSKQQLHTQGYGDKTFWTGAEAMLGQNVVAESTAKAKAKGQNPVEVLTKQMERLKPALQQGQEGYFGFLDLINTKYQNAGEKTQAQMEKLIGTFKDGRLDEFHIDEDNFSKVAELLQMSDDSLTSMLHNAMQFADLDFMDSDAVRKNLATSNEAIAGNGKSGGNQNLFVSEDYLRQQILDADYRPEKVEGILDKLDKQGIKTIPSAKDLGNDTAAFFKNNLGVTTQQDLIDKLLPTGLFNESQIADYAKNMMGKDLFDPEQFHAAYNDALSKYEDPTGTAQVEQLTSIHSLVANILANLDPNHKENVEQATADFKQLIQGNTGIVDTASEKFAMGQDAEGNKLTAESFKEARQNLVDIDTGLTATISNLKAEALTASGDHLDFLNQQIQGLEQLQEINKINLSTGERIHKQNQENEKAQAKIQKEAHKMGGHLPEDESKTTNKETTSSETKITHLTADDEASPVIDEAQDKADTFDNTEAEAKVEADTTGANKDLENTENKLDDLDGKTAETKVTTTTEQPEAPVTPTDTTATVTITGDSTGAISAANGAVTTINGLSATITIKGNKDSAIAAANSAVNSINAKSASVKVTAYYDGNTVKIPIEKDVKAHTGGYISNNHSVIYRAKGGSIFKPKGTDTIPAMLTPGEYVQKRDAVEYFGVDFMRQINHKNLFGALASLKGKTNYRSSGGMISYYNKGGNVSGKVNYDEEDDDNNNTGTGIRAGRGRRGHKKHTYHKVQITTGKINKWWDNIDRKVDKVTKKSKRLGDQLTKIFNDLRASIADVNKKNKEFIAQNQKVINYNKRERGTAEAALDVQRYKELELASRSTKGKSKEEKARIKAARKRLGMTRKEAAKEKKNTDYYTLLLASSSKKGKSKEEKAKIDAAREKLGFTGKNAYKQAQAAKAAISRANRKVGISYEYETKDSKGRLKGKTATKKTSIDPTKFLKWDSASGTWVIDQNKINNASKFSYINSKGEKVTKINKDKAEAIYSATDSYLKDMESTIESSTDAIEEAQNNLAEYRKQIDDAFFGWKNELTQVLRITSEIERTEEAINALQARKERVQFRLDNIDLSFGAEGTDLKNYFVQLGLQTQKNIELNNKENDLRIKKIEANKAEMDSMARLTNERVKYEDINGKVKTESEFDMYRRISKIVDDDSDEAGVGWDKLSTQEKKIFARQQAFQRRIITGNSEKGFSLDEKGIANYIASIKNGEIQEELGSLLKEVWDDLNEKTLENLQLQTEIYNTETENLQLNKDYEDQAKQIAEQLYGWKNSLTKILELTNKIELAEKRISYLKSADELFNKQLLSGQSTASNKMSGDIMATYIAQMMDTVTSIQLTNAKLDEQRADLQSYLTGEDISKEIDNLSSAAPGMVNLARLEELQKELEIRQLALRYGNITQNDDGTVSVSYNSDLIEKEKGSQFDANTANAIEQFYQDLTTKSSEIRDTMQSSLDKTSDLYQALIDLRQEYADRAREIREAYVAQKQQEIDNIKTLYGAIDNNFKELINQTKQNIQLRRQTEDNAKTEGEISKKQQRLSMLRADTTGGNQVTIAQLQKEITEAQQAYGRTLEDQLIEQLSIQGDVAAKQRERQLELMQAQHNIAKETGIYAKEIDEWFRDGSHRQEMIDLLKTSENWDELTKAEQNVLSGQLTEKLTTINTTPLKIEGTTDAIGQLTKSITGENNGEGGLASDIGETVGVSVKESSDATINAFKELSDKLFGNEAAGIVGAFSDLNSAVGGVSSPIVKALTSAIFGELTDKEIENKVGKNGLWGALAGTIGEVKTAIASQPIEVKIDLSTLTPQTGAEDKESYKEAGQIISETLSQPTIGQPPLKIVPDTTKKTPSRDGVGGEIHLLDNGSQQSAQNIAAVKAEEKQLRELSDKNKAKQQIASLDSQIKSLTATKNSYQNQYNSFMSRANGATNAQTAAQFRQQANAQLTQIRTIENEIKGLQNQITKLKQEYGFKTGGLASYTGPAWLDGTPSKPELVLNAKDTQNFLALRDVLDKALTSTNSITNSYGGDAMYEININVDHLSSDYDVDKVVEKVKKEIVKGSGYRNVTQVRNFR